MDNLKKRRRGAFKPHSDEELRRQKADEALRESRRRFRNPLAQIEAGLSGDNKTAMQWCICRLTHKAKTAHLNAFKRILDVLVKKNIRWISDTHLISGVWHIAERMGVAIRDVESWSPGTHNSRRQFSSLARYLFAKYDMPIFFDSAWLVNCREAKLWRHWFVLVAQGTALRQIAECKIEITKRIQHHMMQAPDDLNVGQAIRWGQVLSLGGSIRLARELAGSLIDQPQKEEAFWTTVVQFLCANPMLDPVQVGPMIDYLQNRRFRREPDRIIAGQLVPGEVPEPNLSMKGRTVESILRQMQTWHNRLVRVPRRQNSVWEPSGIPELERHEGSPGNMRIWRVLELLSTGELVEEGRKLHHCVASYEHSCLSQRCSIYSLRLIDRAGTRPLVTIEVNIKSRMIVQARGQCNRKVTPIETRVMRTWASEAGLQIAGHVLEP